MDFDRKLRLLNPPAQRRTQPIMRFVPRRNPCRCGADAARLDVGHARAATRHRRIELSSEGMGTRGWGAG